VVPAVWASTHNNEPFQVKLGHLLTGATTHTEASLSLTPAVGSSLRDTHLGPQVWLSVQNCVGSSEEWLARDKSKMPKWRFSII
jgi:hypothetical protein